ncbi:MAG: hypothetical protein R2867_15650 [Caldilineaceae bacterium]
MLTKAGSADAPVADEHGPVVDSNVVRLIPRMREWVVANYPGTKLAITEYNWGALDHINGALAQADVLGIFGREGLDMALLFDSPYSTDGKFTADGPGAYAFRIYRNYDGVGSKFGETSVAPLAVIKKRSRSMAPSGAVTVR